MAPYCTMAPIPVLLQDLCPSGFQEMLAVPHIGMQGSAFGLIMSTTRNPDPWADPKHSSNLGLHTRHHRGITIQQSGSTFWILPRRDPPAKGSSREDFGRWLWVLDSPGLNNENPNVDLLFGSSHGPASRIPTDCLPGGAAIARGSRRAGDMSQSDCQV